MCGPVRAVAMAFRCAAFGIAAISSAAGAQVLFRANLASSGYPNYNFDLTRSVPSCFATAPEAGTGPAGQDGARVTFVANGCNNQFTAGWDKYTPWTATPGSRRYVRYLQRINAPWAPGFGTTAKYGIIGSNNSRVIIQVNTTNGGNGLRMYVAKNIDAFPGATTPSVDLTVGVPQWIQVEMTCETSGSADDASLKLWVDHSDYARPSAERYGLNISYDDWSGVGWPGFWNEPIAGSPTASLTLYALEVSTEFDPTWSGSSAVRRPASPQSLGVSP